jgi:hypothetical protein
MEMIGTPMGLPFPYCSHTTSKKKIKSYGKIVGIGVPWWCPINSMDSTHGSFERRESVPVPRVSQGQFGWF